MKFFARPHLNQAGNKTYLLISSGFKRVSKSVPVGFAGTHYCGFSRNLSPAPLAALKVLDLIIRARDINHISSLYVTKKIHEIDYLLTTAQRVPATAP